MNAPPPFLLSFNLELLPGMLRAARLMPAVALASSASPAYQDALRQLQWQVISQSPLSDLEIINDGAWFDMVTALRSAKRASLKKRGVAFSETHDIVAQIDSCEFVIASGVAKDAATFSEIQTLLEYLAPKQIWTKPSARRRHI